MKGLAAQHPALTPGEANYAAPSSSRATTSSLLQSQTILFPEDSLSVPPWGGNFNKEHQTSNKTSPSSPDLVSWGPFLPFSNAG